ncbi:MAG: hypothetical protein K6F75_06085 [Butyrivibrio sp.]|nr:hypothetical protein [Butyrivibrio sp.]
MNTRIEKIEEINKNVEALKARMFGEKLSLEHCMDDAGLRYIKVPYGHRHELMGDYLSWDEFRPGGCWGTRDGHYLFRVKLEIPEAFSGKEVFFFLSTGADDMWNTDNPQMLVYVNGIRRCGMDMNHNCLCIYGKEDWEKGTDRLVDVAIYAYSNLAENENYLNIEIAALDEAAKDLYFDMIVPLDAAKELDKGGDGEISDVILKELEEADRISEKGTGDAALLRKASEYLMNNLYGKGENPATVASVGHTHIDVAWKWQLKQTREKVIRSYSTVMELMKRYPEYLFMASTPQMYEFVREEEPELFEEIKEKVREGRFEPEGAMWLEADCNITSGESLVRQILYGKRYFEDVFGVRSDALWLPDVFGYSAAMPQILKKSGIRIFMTTKLGWNDTNRFPHDLFMWKGIDGSEIPAYLISTCDFAKADEAMNSGGRLEYTYNGRQNATQIMGTWRAFREKQLTEEVLTCYGFGDGGGGPTWEMLEMNRRLERGVPGVPKTRQETVTRFVDRLLDKVSASNKMPVWDDELYLEYHRGTYTSMGRNKRYNRQLELLLREAEVASVYAALTKGSEYPRKELLDAWKIVMLNQFHDILPGSSIEEVYEDSKEQYEEAITIVKGIIDRADITVGDDKIKKCEGDAGMRWDICDDESICVNTPLYEARFDNKGEIISLYDKELKREIRNVSDSPINRLIAFEDKPKDYDAWNIDANFEDISRNIEDVDKISIEGFDQNGCRVVAVSDLSVSGAKGDQKGNENISEIRVEIDRKFRASTIHQSIIFRENSRRIDFKTKADWHEHQTLLKTAFPVDVDAKEISCEIQYGSLKRNLARDNDRDKAKFECCAHKWIDITDDSGEFGVAILNDCKYGYDAKEKLMRLTLIKSGIFPNPNADQGEHEFTYSLYPHKGGVAKGKVIEQARDLNFSSHYYISVEDIEKSIVDFSSEDGVFVEAVKYAEDSNDIIVRIYEGYGIDHEVKAQLFKDINVSLGGATICDLLENDTQEEISFDKENKTIEFALKPYEIKTIKIQSEA